MAVDRVAPRAAVDAAAAKPVKAGAPAVREPSSAAFPAFPPYPVHLAAYPVYLAEFPVLEVEPPA